MKVPKKPSRNLQFDYLQLQLLHLLEVVASVKNYLLLKTKCSSCEVYSLNFLSEDTRIRFSVIACDRIA